MIDMIDELRNSLHQAQTGTTEGSLERAIGVYQLAAGYISVLETIQTEAKQLIGEIFLETGCTDVKTQSGRAYVSKPSVIVTYKAKDIDAACAEDAELAAKLAPFRTVTERAGTLTIRSVS